MGWLPLKLASLVPDTTTKVSNFNKCCKEGSQLSAGELASGCATSPDLEYTLHWF